MLDIKKYAKITDDYQILERLPTGCSVPRTTSRKACARIYNANRPRLQSEAVGDCIQGCGVLFHEDLGGLVALAEDVDAWL